MKRVFVLLLLVILMGSESMARRSIVTISSEWGDKIQVLVEGKVINAIPKSVVKISSSPGQKEIQVNVFSSKGTLEVGYCETLKIKSDFRSHFLLSCNEEDYLAIRRIKEKREYSVLDIHPELLYHRKHISSTDSHENASVHPKYQQSAFWEEKKAA